MATIRELLEGAFSTTEESERDCVYERMFGLSIEGVAGVVDKGDGVFEGSVTLDGSSYLLRARSLAGGRRAKVRLRIVSRSGPGVDGEALALRVSKMALEDPGAWGMVAVDIRDGEMDYVAQVSAERLEKTVGEAVDWLRLHGDECLGMAWACGDGQAGERRGEGGLERLLSILGE